MSSERKYNSKGQLIEELDIHIIKAPFQSPMPVSRKRPISEIKSVPEPSAKKLKKNSIAEPFPKMAHKMAHNLAPPFPKVEEAEILAWCDAYLSLKNRGINIYKI
jgi:hypothetical protein